MVWVKAGLIVLLLVACGGGGGDAPVVVPVPAPIPVTPPVLPPVPPPVPVDIRLARLDAYDAQSLRVLGQAPDGGIAASVTDVPMQGSARFAGFASVRIEGADPLVLFGDAQIDVGFGSQQITGQMNRFFGTNTAGIVADYSGVINVTGGQVRPDLQLDFAGALSASGQQLAINGQMDGMFLGDPIGAMTALDLDPVVMQNGLLRTGTMLVVLETIGVQMP